MTCKQDKAIVETALRQIRMSDSEEQVLLEMTSRDIYEQTLRSIPDDATVRISHGTDFPIQAKKSNLVWSERMLLVKSAEPATSRKKHKPDAIRTRMCLIPTSLITCIEATYDSDADGLRAIVEYNQQMEAESMTEADAEFAQLDLDESELETLFGSDNDKQLQSLSKATSETHPMSYLAHRSSISSYDQNGLFINCYRLRNMSSQASNSTIRCSSPVKKYRHQWRRFFNRNVSCEGTLTHAEELGNCIKLTLDQTRIIGVYRTAIWPYPTDIRSQPVSSVSPIDNVSLFVSNDFIIPEIGTTLSVNGMVYAYPVRHKNESRHQLGLIAWTIGKLPWDKTFKRNNR